MTSSYPNGLDSLATNIVNATSQANVHPQHHNDMADAINKIEAELGAAPSGSRATVAAYLSELETRIQALEGGQTPVPVSMLKGFADGLRFSPTNTTRFQMRKDAGAQFLREEYMDATSADQYADSVNSVGLKWQILCLQSTLTVQATMQTIASRYGPGGTKYCCDVLELGNEPYWDGTPVATYATAAKQAITWAKAANPNIKCSIAIGPPGLTWIDQLEAAAPGILAATDYFHHHPYTNRQATYADPTVWDPNSGNWELMWQRFVKYRQKLVGMGYDKPWLLTETGWHTGGTYPDYAFSWTQAQQADFISKAFVLARGFGWVQKMSLFTFADHEFQAAPCGSSTNGENYYGIVLCNFTHKTGYNSFLNG